jgi:hypothetical protein
MILMASQQARSRSFNTPRHPRKCLPVQHRMSFRGRGRQLARKTMVMVFFTARKLIVLDVLPRGSTLNWLYFINHIFPDLKTANLNFRRQKTGSTIWVHMDNSYCHNVLNVTSKIKKNHISEYRTRPIPQI